MEDQFVLLPVKIWPIMLYRLYFEVNLEVCDYTTLLMQWL